jgi:hypothetical protein
MTANLSLSLAKQLDKPVATLIVSSDSGTKRFIGEALLAAAALYLLKKYCDKYLEGIGFDEIAKSHGKKTREFIEKLREGSTVPEQLTSSAQKDVDEAVRIIEQNPPNEAAKADAELAVEEVVIESGGLKPQGRETAILVSKVVFSSR